MTTMTAYEQALSAAEDDEFPRGVPRRERVLLYLRTHLNAWVDGPDLANANVGGSEGLRRLRELRADGYAIEDRRHPDPKRAVRQYRLTAYEPGGAAMVPEDRNREVMPPRYTCPKKKCSIALTDIRNSVSPAWVYGQCFEHGYQLVAKQ